MSNLTSRSLTKKGIGTGHGKPFSRLAAVREFLQDQAKDLIDEYRALARESITQGKPDVAEKILWNLIDSMPKEDGIGLVDSPSSKPPKELSSGPAAPSIQIGVILGNQQPQHQLPPLEVIDVTPRKGEHEKTQASPQGTQPEPLPIMEQPSKDD